MTPSTLTAGRSGHDVPEVAEPRERRVDRAGPSGPTVWVRPSERGAGNAGPLLLSVSTAVALARLISGGFSARVLVPLVVAIVVADTLTALAVHLRAWVPAAVALGLMVSLAALAVSVDPSLIVPSSSHFFSGAWLSAQFHAARFALAEDGTPLPRLPGVIIGIGALGGTTAALTRAAWVLRPRVAQRGTGRSGTLAPCIAPSFALFVYSTLISSDRGRTAAAVAYVLGTLVFVMMADRRSSFSASARRSLQWRPDVSTLVGASAALLVVIGAGAGLSGMRLSVFHVTPPGQALASPSTSTHGGSGLLTGTDLLANLRTVELTQSRTVILRASSPIATYWEVGTLSTFTGTEWVPTPGSASALAGSADANPTDLGPPALPAPSPASMPTFSARVTITDLLSRLLPAPPHTVAVSGLAGPTATTDAGVLAAAPSRRGTTYAVTAWLNTTDSVEGPQLAPDDPRLAPYLALPSEPAVVSRLAHEAVGDITTPAFEVQALVNWFRSGRFRYTLTPPATTGPDPLVQFLTVTKAGYCQQFAGAFGVLARSLGIPTRLVVGFLAGQAGAGNTFTITGADAHVWPQVYLGPGAGWVSVEPTPQVGTGTAAPLGVLEPSTGPEAASGPTPASPTTTPGVTPTSAPVSTQGSRAVGGKAHTAGAGRTSTGHHAGAGTPWWVWAAVPLGLAAVFAVVRRLAAGARGRRQASDTGLGPDERVVRAWERALAALRGIGLGRRIGETPSEYIKRVRASTAWAVDAVPPSGGAARREVDADALEELALLVEQACYDPMPCTWEQAADARDLAAMVIGRRSGRDSALAVSARG